MKVAAYVRPWSKDYFEYILPKAFPGAKTFLLSDFRDLGDYDWAGRFYSHYKRPMGDVRVPIWLDIHAEHEIIARSFLLRSMSMTKASHLIRAMSKSIEDMLDEIQPDVLISPSADSYVMDLLVRHCAHRKIPYCGLLPCPFPGYTRATAIGEYISFRQPTEEECYHAVSSVANPAFQPVDLKEWLKLYGSSYVYLKRSLRELPKRYVFPLIGWWKRDPKNYHYIASALSSVSFLSQALFINHHFEKNWHEVVESWKSLKVYIPLQAFPESTTDYHVSELDLIDFPRLLPRIIDVLGKDPGILICIKEHPGMMGARPPGFYGSISRRKNVVLISGDVAASELIAATDIMLTWTGTGGLEAALRGKPVITLGTPYYSYGPLFKNIHNLDALDRIHEVAASLKGISVSKDNKQEVARHVLSGTFPGEFRFIRFNPNDMSLKKDADDLIEGLRKYWVEWQEAFMRHQSN